MLEELRKDVKKVAVVVSPDAEQIAEIGELGFLFDFGKYITIPI